MSRLDSSDVFQERKPNWVILREAAHYLVKNGKTVFTRKELTRIARQIDNTRSEASLDFEIDLVTVNSNSKDRYRDPDKLFLYRLDRGRYTLYNPEIHGSIDEYIYTKTLHVRKEFLTQIISELENRGYKIIESTQSTKPWNPNIVALENNTRIGVWIVDPSQDPSTQMRTLAYTIGSSILNRNLDKHIIILPQIVMNKIPTSVREELNRYGIKLVVLKEEKKYSITL